MGSEVRPALYRQHNSYISTEYKLKSAKNWQRDTVLFFLDNLEYSFDEAYNKNVIFYHAI